MPEKDYKQGRNDSNNSRDYQRNQQSRNDGPSNRDYNRGYQQGQNDKTIQRQQREDSR